MWRGLVGTVLAVLLLAACSNNTTTIIAAPPASDATTISSTASSIPSSPSTDAIDRVCATLTVQLQIVEANLKGQDGRQTTDVMGSVSRALDKVELAVQETDAYADLQQLASDAEYVAEYNGSNIGVVLDRVGTFADDAKAFWKTYCVIL